MRQWAWLVVLFCGVSGAAEPDKWLVDFVATAKVKAQSDLIQSKSDLDLAKKGKVIRGKRGKTDKGFVFDNVNEKKEAVAKYTFAVKSTEALLKGQFGALTDDELVAGVIGVPYYPLGIIQVTGDSSSIVDIGYSPPYGRAFSQDPQRHVWLQASTVGWTDGKRVDMKYPVAVIGTKRYETATGSKTIPMVRLLKADEIQQFVELMKAK